MKISVKNLSMQFKSAERTIDIFKNVDLELDSASRLAIVGRSGVGKTTLLYILAGLEFASSGEISYDGVQLTKAIDLAAFRRKNIGFIFQFHYLLPEFSAEENVALPLIIQGLSKKEAIERAAALLDSVGLSDRLSHRPGMLSGGEQQRVAIARAFVTEPSVILADEPTGNLDQQTGENVMSLLLDLQERSKMTLIVVTHSHELASKMNIVKELKSDGLYEKNIA